STLFYTLSLHDALPISHCGDGCSRAGFRRGGNQIGINVNSKVLSTSNVLLQRGNGITQPRDGARTEFCRRSAGAISGLGDAVAKLGRAHVCTPVTDQSR